MAVRVKANGTRGLNYTATLDIREAKRNALELKKTLADLGISAANGMDPKPLNGYQQAQIALKKTLIDSQRETERLKQQAASYRSEVEKGKVAQQEQRTELARLNVAEQQLRNSFQQGRITQQQYQQQLTQGRIAQQALNQSLVQGRIDQQNLRNEITRINLARKQELEAQRQARKAAQEVAGSYNEAQKRLRDLGFEIRSTGNAMRTLTPELKAKVKEYNDLNDALKRFDERMGNHQRNVGNYRGAIRNTAEDLLGFASAYLSAGAALTYVFNQTLAFQRLRTPLSFILGSEGAADAKLKELQNFADQIGVEYFGIANSYKQFTAAAKASNFDLRESENIFRSVAKAGAVLGLSNETLEGTFLALQQMISKGTVQSEELRGQLSERLPGAFSLAAKAMGVTERELGKLLETGSVTAAEMLPKLAKELDKAYGNKAKDGISGLNAELGRLNSEVQAFAGQGSFLERNLFQPIVRGAKSSVQGLRELFRGDGFMDFLKNATTFTGKEFRSRQNLYDLRDMTKNTNSSLVASQGTDYTAKNLKELRNSYQEADIAYKKAATALLDFNEKSKSANTATKAEYKEQLSALKTYAEGYRLERMRIGKQLDRAKNDQMSTNKEIADSLLTSISDIRKRINQLQKLPGSALEGSEIYNRIKALKERLKAGGKELSDTVVSSQRTLQAEIDALTKKGSDKRKSADDQELAEVDAKYKKLREKAIAFNNDPKNKAKGLKVDASGLLRAQSDEESALRDKQKSETLKTTIEKEKKLYEDFENYKAAFGLEKAKERYGKLINVDQTYLENLKSKQESLLGDDKAKGGDAGGGEFVAKQQKVLEEAAKEAVQEEQKKTDALLKEFMSYADKRKVLIEIYNKEFKDLEGNAGAQAERTKRYEKELKELDDANSKKLESYQEMLAGIERMSVKSALKAIEKAEVQFQKDIKNKSIVDPEEIKKAEQYFQDLKNAIKQGTGQELQGFANKMDEVLGQINDMDDYFKRVLSTVNSVVGQIGNIKGFRAEMNKKGATGLEMNLAGLGILGAGFSIFKSVASLFDRSEQREAQASYARDLQNKQTEALNKALERQVALLDDVYGTERIKNYDAAIKQARENEAKYASQLTGRYQLTGDAQLDEFLTKLNNGEKIDPTYQGIVEKARRASSLLPSDINTLQRLLDEGKLDSNTATIVQNLIKANETAQELANNLRAENVGSTLDQIADDFISTLTDGTRDFGKSFEETIQKSILNGFKGELIRTQLQAFYTQFAELSQGGLTNSEIEELRKTYLAASEKAKKDLEALSKATGIDLTGNGTSTSQNTLKGNVESLTENTGSKIVGAFNGMRLVQMETLQEVKLQSKSIGDLFLSVRDNAAILMKIERNTKETADNTSSAIPLLKSIAENTKGSLDAQLRAAGKYGY